jgi:TPR repeat protein
MKANPLVWLFLFLMLGVADAQQTNSSRGVTNSATIEELRAKAEKGDAEAQCLLGAGYYNGDGVAQDYAQAITWFRKAAEQNLAVAQFMLGLCYEYGQGVAKDKVEAVRWYRKAAEQNDAGAQFSLGVCYDEGQGVAKDKAEAMKWYRKAAEQNADAQCYLGDCYHDGDGVKKDAAEAVKWYRKAAEHNFAKAQYNLGVCYYAGKGLAQDYAEACKWFRKAAEQNYASAQYNLGLCYGKGQGVPQNDVETYIWLSLAAAQDVKNATHNRDILASRMSREEIIEGQRRAAAFVPHKETSSSSSDNSISPENPTFTGTGFFITDNGYLISNYHVVKNATKVRLLTSAGLIDAKVVQVDAANDLALLKADGRFAPLPIAASRTVNLGGMVATIGFPDIGLQGFAPKLAKGEIASLSGAGDDPRYFQISVPVQPGNSGGALVDDRGNVIGIVSAKLDASAALAASGALPENVNYAVKSSLLLSFLESVPAVSAKLKEPITADRKFEDVVKSAQDAAVLVLVY